jgi:hypothetical protein
VSLDEFCGALNRLNEIKAWKKYVESRDDKRRRKMWADAVKFFNAKKKRIETIRGDIGGHFLESAARWSVERPHEDTTGALQIDYGDKTADAKLPFATELVASLILRTAREQELPDDEMKAFISGIFDDVTDGWQPCGRCRPRGDRGIPYAALPRMTASSDPSRPSRPSCGAVPFFKYLAPSESAEGGLVTLIFTSWNPLISWLTRIDSFRLAA